MCPTLEDIFFFFFILFRQQLYLVAAVLAAIIMFLFASFTAKVSSLLCGRWDNDFLSESSFLLQLLSLCTHCNSLHVCWTWMSESSSLQPEYHVGLLGQPSKICLTFFWRIVPTLWDMAPCLGRGLHLPSALRSFRLWWLDILNTQKGFCDLNKGWETLGLRPATLKALRTLSFKRRRSSSN